ncbi:TAT-dependent nitrous-oxide reductase [Oligella ureolytica]
MKDQNEKQPILEMKRRRFLGAAATGAAGFAGGMGLPSVFGSKEALAQSKGTEGGLNAHVGQVS